MSKTNIAILIIGALTIWNTCKIIGLPLWVSSILCFIYGFWFAPFEGGDN